eukprot:TRINITY_DN72525_c0_g1_i1.p1 TRINITY_DN72525_c0_g1~~TRINITY_DN72525_c0_g1_i1.p1  ORF type:complete len:625 (+),score=133.91 TRINITY_DN72525_c0_g1_i1:56-1930(+)
MDHGAAAGSLARNGGNAMRRRVAGGRRTAARWQPLLVVEAATLRWAIWFAVLVITVPIAIGHRDEDTAGDLAAAGTAHLAPDLPRRPPSGHHATPTPLRRAVASVDASSHRPISPHRSAARAGSAASAAHATADNDTLRSDGELAPTAPAVAGASHGMLLELGSHLAAGSNASLSTGVEMIPGMSARDMAKWAAYCAICILIYKVVSSFDCNTRKLDVRRCKPCKKFLLYIGWDEFEAFGVRLTVHSVQDIQATGTFGGANEFQVDVRFFWSKFSTSPTNDLRWEQSKGMEVPQGASECVITLTKLGTISNTTMAEYSMDTKETFLEKTDIYKPKTKLKMMNAGKLVGTLIVTFRKKGEDDEEEVPIAGVDEDSSLAMELIKAYEELCKEPGYKPLEKGQKFEGADKLSLLAEVLQGDLREIDLSGNDKGKVFCKVIGCNFAELQGEDMEAELKKQWKKAQAKGLTELEKKWFWVWYESRKEAEHEKKWHFPDGFIPLIAISGVHRSPDRNDQFIVKYSGGDTEALIYRREPGKGLDTWADGLDLAFNEARTAVKAKKEAEKKQEETMKKMRPIHQAYIQQFGFPQSEEDWNYWTEHFKEQNFQEEHTNAFYTEVMENAAKGKY